MHQTDNGDNAQKVKVGIVLTRQNINKNDYDIIEHIEKSSHIFQKPTLILKKTPKKNTPARINPEIYLKNFMFKIISKLELMILASDFNVLECSKTIDVNSLNIHKIHIISVESKNKHALNLKPSDKKNLENEKLDLLIHLGNDDLDHDIISCAKHGVLQFGHCYKMTANIGSSGFWEVIQGRPSSEFIIHQVQSRSNEKICLLHGKIMTKQLWLANDAFLARKVNGFVKKILTNFAGNGIVGLNEHVTSYHDSDCRAPTARDLLTYMWRCYSPILKAKFERFLGRRQLERWGIAYAKGFDFDVSKLQCRKIENPKNRFLADPFVLESGGRTFCFAEDFFYAEKKGKISAIEIFDDGYKHLGVVLEEDCHLSYPFLLKDGEDIYMIPETANAREIRLYKAKDFPFGWELDKVLMSNVSAADTIVFPHNGTWFMLTNICSADIKDHSSELHAFCSTSLKSNDWQPLKQGNPLFVDSGRSRNGGWFMHDNELIRVNQVHGKAHYGKSFVINNIEHLSRERIVENKMRDVYPDFFGGIHSTHHFHTNGKISVIDYCGLE